MTGAYKNRRKQELILRDHLALDRTVLANERTFLSYIRTALALVVVGATLLHFSQDSLLKVVAATAIFLGIITLVVGILRTLAVTRDIQAFRKKS